MINSSAILLAGAVLISWFLPMGLLSNLVEITFQPVMKLESKTRHGAKVHKVYDRARTPYQRLREASVLTEAKRQELAAIYHGLNPVSLLKQVNENLEHLWNLAEPTTRQQRITRTHDPSVTVISDATMAVR